MFQIKWKDEEGRQHCVPLNTGTPLVFGRSLECDVVLDDELISRRHFEVCVKDDGVILTDLGSTNGTRLDSQPISITNWETDQHIEAGTFTFELVHIGDIDGSVMGDTAAHETDSPAATGREVKFDDIPQVDSNLNKEQKTSQGGTWVGRYIRRHWRGEHHPWWSYLINISIFYALALVALFNITSWAAVDGSPNTRLAVLTVLFIGLNILWIWQIVGLWRSVFKSRERGAWWITRWSAFALGLLFTVNVPVGWYQYVTAFTSFRAIANGLGPQGAPMHRLSVSNNRIIFDGDVTWPVIADFRKALSENNQITAVILRSDGGDTTASRRIHDMLRGRSITTAVSQTCFSACTMIYAAGARRVITNTGQLGYHATSVISADPMMTRIMNAVTFGHDALNAEYLRRAGVAEPFIQRAYSTPATDLWIPTIPELQQANAITGVLSQ